jgi:hypothetical protein
MPALTEEQTDLHKHFRSVMMLYTLITALNNDGSPKCGSNEHIYTSFEELPIFNRILYAIPQVLIQDHEVIAATAHGSAEIGIMEQTVLDDEGIEILSLDEEEELLRTVQSGFSAIANPDDEDSHLDNNMPFCVLSDKGGSHWSSIVMDQWYCVKIG